MRSDIKEFGRLHQMLTRLN